MDEGDARDRSALERSSEHELATTVSSTLFGDPALADVLSQCPDKLTRVALEPGASLFEQGDAADALYVVSRGTLAASIRDRDGIEIEVGRISKSEPVGEVQVFSGGARTATVKAVDACELIRIPRLAIDNLAKSAPTAYEKLSSNVDKRLRRNRLISALTELLGEVDDTVVADVERVAAWHRVGRGETLFRRGDPGDSMLLVVSGRLRAAIREEGSEERVLGEIRRGETVGEAAPFLGTPRAADVYALRDSELISLDNDVFEDLGDKHPRLVRRLAALALTRLQRAQGTGAELAPTTTIAVVGICDDVDLDQFTSELSGALASAGSTMAIRSDSADQALGTPGLSALPLSDARGRRIDAWIDELETRHRFVLLQTDSEASSWGRRCLRQADEVILVGSAESDPSPSPNERELLGDAAESAKLVLVLVHPESTKRPANTHAWLKHRNVSRHHHVRRGVQTDTKRVARFLAGRALGVAFGGGGARGFAHIGVVRAMVELGMPIDSVGGTSMGAMIAAQVALGWEHSKMGDACTSLFGNWAVDLTLPYVSLLGGHRSRVRMGQSIPDIQIEDLWLPFFSVSSSLMTGQIVKHDHGRLHTGLRASASLPGILPPVVVDDDMLVDGALLRNLPADMVADTCCGGPVIALDVSGPIEMSAGGWTGDSVSGWRLLAQQLNPWAKRSTVPSIGVILQRSIEVPGAAVERSVLEGFGGLYMKLPVQEFGLLDFKDIDNLIKAGYEHALPLLTQWLEENELMI